MDANRFTKAETDGQLVEQLQNGEVEVLEHIYRKYAAHLYQTVYNIIRNKEAAEDIIHDLFVDLWLRRANYNIIQLKPYLFAAARSRVLMALRSGKIKVDLSALDLLAAPAEADDLTALTEINTLLNRELQTLPEKCREIYALSRMEQLTHKEIARLKNISVKTVENQISIALKRLRPALKDYLTVLAFFIFSAI
jgi:RNA polymerase sigma-70 factor (family 1)